MRRDKLTRIKALVPYPIECIEWVDSVAVYGWEKPFDEPPPMMIVSIGWVTLENETVVRVTSHRQIEPVSHSGDMTIPKVSIVRRTRL